MTEKKKIEWNIKDIERRIKDYETNIIPNTNKQVYDTTKEKERHVTRVNEELEKLKSELKIRQEDLKNYKYPVYHTEGQETQSSSPTKVGDEDIEGTLLSLIRKGEAGSKDQYNMMNQGDTGKSGTSLKILGKALTEMTVAEVMAQQKKSGEEKLFAAGAYQIIPKTLKGLVDQGVVDPSDKFNETTQDTLAKALLKEAGLGRKSNEEVYERVSKIWAFVENPHTGKSTYDGIGGNKSNSDLSNKIKDALGGNYNNTEPVKEHTSTGTIAENKKYPNILDIFDGIGSLVKNVPSEVSKEFPGVTKELEKGWGEMRSYAMKRLELPPVVVNNQQPQQPPSNQGVPQNLASISSVVDQDFIALLFNKSMWGSPTSSV